MDQTKAEELFHQHIGRAEAYLKIYLTQINPSVRYLRKDIWSEMTMALWRCCQKYDESNKNTFWTFAYLRVRGSITDYLRREKLQVRGDRLDSQITFLPLVPEMYESVNSKRHDDLEAVDAKKRGPNNHMPPYLYSSRGANPFR